MYFWDASYPYSSAADWQLSPYYCVWWEAQILWIYWTLSMLDFTTPHPLLYKGIKDKKKIDAAFLSYMYTESSRRERQLQRQSIVSEELLGRSFEKRVRSSWRKHQGLFPYGKIRCVYAYISAVDFIFICGGFHRISRHALVPFIETRWADADYVWKLLRKSDIPTYYAWNPLGIFHIADCKICVRFPLLWMGCLVG